MGPDVLKGQESVLGLPDPEHKGNIIYIYLSALCNIPEDLSFQKHVCENLKSHFSTVPGII